MKKFFIFLFVLLAINSIAQPNMKFRLSASSVIDYSFANIYEYKKSFTSTNSYFPFKTGLNFMFRFPPHWSLITGYNFVYRYMEVSMNTTTVGDLFYGYRMYTSEIPILLRYDGGPKNIDIGLYGELGLSFDFMYAEQNVFGGYYEQLDYIVLQTWGYFYTMNFPNGFTPAFHVKCGFTNRIGNNKGIIDIGISYHQQVPKKISNDIIYYYSDGVGNVTRENYQFYTASSYLGIDLSYFLPYKITLFDNKKSE